MARTRNYIPKQQKRLVAAVASVVIVLAGAGVVWAINQPAAPAPAPVATTAAPTMARTFAPTAEATPIPAPPSVTAPEQGPVDMSNPEAVAIAWAQAYFTRPTGDDTTFQTAIEPYVDPSLSEYMRTDEYNVDGKGYWDQSEGTRVLDVKVTPQDGSVGRDTPIRWTRTVEVTVEGIDTGKKVVVPYIVELRRSDTFWFIIGAPKAIRMGD